MQSKGDKTSGIKVIMIMFKMLNNRLYTKTREDMGSNPEGGGEWIQGGGLRWLQPYYGNLKMPEMESKYLASQTHMFNIFRCRTLSYPPIDSYRVTTPTPPPLHKNPGSAPESTLDFADFLRESVPRLSPSSQLFESWITVSSLDKSNTIQPANVFHLLVLSFGEISVQANDSNTFTFVLYKIHLGVYRVFPTYFIYWIAAYQVDSTIHPLNNWNNRIVGQYTQLERLQWTIN